MRIHELVKELKEQNSSVTNKDVVAFIATLGHPNLTHSSNVPTGTLKHVREHFGYVKPASQPVAPAKPEPTKTEAPQSPIQPQAQPPAKPAPPPAQPVSKDGPNRPQPPAQTARPAPSAPRPQAPVNPPQHRPQQPVQPVQPVMGHRPPQQGQGGMPPRSGQRPPGGAAATLARPKGKPKGKNKRERQLHKARMREERMEQAKPTVAKLFPGMTVKELAEAVGTRETDIIKRLFLKGIMATINQSLELETAELIASEFEIPIELPSTLETGGVADESTPIAAILEEDPSALKPRPPVVTIMGHVDHGKTSLLDAIRSTKVTEGEHGGITQHIGAYQVDVGGKPISFLDTPGHEAFTAMRARGARVTDIAILVVAADDGIMPQTVEAINHAKAAGVPIVVAINKIDKPDAQIDRVKQQLTEHNLVPEEWGGDTIMVPVSAKAKIGLDDLLEMLLLVADVQELKANPNREARGIIIESQLDRARGAVATVLIQNGTLHVGDNFTVGSVYGKVRAMINDKGKRLKKAGPSMPVEIIGFSGVPAAGDLFEVVASEREARMIAERRQIEDREAKILSRPLSLDSVYSQIQEGKLKDLNLVVKADVQGSLEAVNQSLAKLSAEGTSVRIIHAGTGDISESDVLLARASNALVVGFNVKPNPNAERVSKAEDVEIRTYNIIYKLLEDVQKALEGLLEPEMKEVEMGEAEVRAIFKVGKTGVIAGCMVTSGKITRNSQIRVVRNDEVIFTGKLASLKRFKDDAKEVAAGYECGVALEKFNDLQEGDRLQAFVIEAKQRG